MSMVAEAARELTGATLKIRRMAGPADQVDGEGESTW